MFFAVQRSPSSHFSDSLTDSGGFFRSLRSFKVADRRAALAVAQCARDLTAALATEVLLPSPNLPRLPLAPTADPAEAELIAAQVRKQWDVETGPIPNVLSLLEEKGVVCIRYGLGQHSVDAFSVPFSPHPVVVLGSDKDKGERDRFTGAHELGHLVMHDLADAGSKALEMQAHRFAGEFLLPRGDAERILPSRADFRLLVRLKGEWGMSIGALLRRAKDVGVMPEKTYVQAVKYMAMRGWNKHEPGDTGKLESPSVLVRALQTLPSSDSVRDLSTMTGWPDDLVRKLILESSDPRPRVEW